MNKIKEIPFLLIFDLYWLRYVKPGDQWYELTDYLRNKLEEDGYKISYDDKNKDIIFSGAKPGAIEGGTVKNFLNAKGITL